MAQRDELVLYVKEALIAGRARTEISAALSEAGWSGGEIDDALRAWVDDGRAPPTPRPRPVVSARDFFVYALTFVMLLMSAIFLINLLTSAIDMIWPDPDYGREYALQSLRFAIAVIVVTAPIYGWATWSENARMARDPGVGRSVIRKWMIYLTLLVSAFAVIGDLVAVIAGFLNGDLTQVYLLKALSVAVVAGLIFAYYRHESRRGEI